MRTSDFFVSASLVTLAACAGPTASEMSVPVGLTPMPAASLHRLIARGVQIYDCRAAADVYSAPQWTLVAPQADLFDGSGAAPALHHNSFPDAQPNPATGPVQQFHLGLRFNAPADAARAGCPGDVTPFNGEHVAGIQALSMRNAPHEQGPLKEVQP